MLRSMTGYGSAERADGGHRVRVEVRSVNQRFLDFQLKAPRVLMQVEDRIRKAIESSLARGRVSVYVEWKDENSETAPVIHEAAAEELVGRLRELGERLSLAGDVDVAALSRFPQLFEQDAGRVEADDVWSVLEPALRESIARLLEMREAEGRALRAELDSRIGAVEGLVDAIESEAPSAAEAARARLTERIRALVDDSVGMDEARLAQEIAMLADKSDFTEEMVRLRAHIEQARACLDADVPTGKRLNFLIQEMHREANTTGSKNVDVELGKTVVTLKEEIEKLREQVQNVE